MIIAPSSGRPSRMKSSSCSTSPRRSTPAIILRTSIGRSCPLVTSPKPFIIFNERPATPAGRSFCCSCCPSSGFCCCSSCFAPFFPFFPFFSGFSPGLYSCPMTVPRFSKMSPLVSKGFAWLASGRASSSETPASSAISLTKLLAFLSRSL